MKTFMEPPYACTKTFNVGETNQAKESFQEKKAGLCTSNPFPKMKQCNQVVVKKHFINKKLLKDNDGDEECVGLVGAALGQDVLVSSEKTNSLGQNLSGSQDVSQKLKRSP
jgi:hypothetical protein